MRINYNKGTFILDSSDAVHAAMIEDFQDESKLNYFVDLLNLDHNTAFQIYNSGISFFDKESYLNTITQQIQEIVDNQARELDYDDIKDVPTENFEGGKYQQEAISLLSWSSNLWILRDEYFKTINTEQDINNSFIENLPKFNKNG